MMRLQREPDSMGRAPKCKAEVSGKIATRHNGNQSRHVSHAFKFLALMNDVRGGVAVLQTAEMHNGRSNFMLEIKRGWHLHRVFEVEGGYSCVAEEEGAARELLSQANLEQV